ncbi:C6 zinc finger domain [Fusarium albosuccineum]|uniref:C6 zinc finger domain n=1 Tax=Fusarium albosuccineum TaxID=1237068 RepID=A0A8H4L176_9HYPO|nr:C6 zinc finger domain [Fusarium albosuccineum]
MPSPSQAIVVCDSGGSRATSGHPIKQPVFIPTPERDAVDMELLWFYTKNTASASFVFQAERLDRIYDILKVQIPRNAFQHPFLMDCLLAISALQMQHLNQNMDALRAIHHRARAFEGYRKAVQEAKPETAFALIACSMLFTCLSSHIFREEHGRDLDLHVLDWMVVWRGISPVIDMVSPRRLWELGMAELFFRPSIDLNKAAFYIPNSLLHMMACIGEDDPECPDVGTYYLTLQYLGSLYMSLQDGFSPELTSRIITWPTFVPEEFVALARKKQPRALIILAHWLLFIKTIDYLWWVTDIGDREIRGILRHLGDAWSLELAAPRLSLALNSRLSVARLLLNDPSWESSPTVLKNRLSTHENQHFISLDGESQWIATDSTSIDATPPTVIHSVPAWDTRGFQQDKITLVALDL